MADNTTLNPGTGGDVIASDDVAGVKYQVVKLAVGADGAASLVANANPIPVSDAGGTLTVDGTVAVTHAALTELAAAIDTELQVDVVGALPTGDNNIGNVDVLTVPADPFGANADAASATGSISAKLRFIANTGIPVTGTVTVASHAVTNAGTFATQVDGAALTALQLIDNIVLAEDAAHQSGDAGVMALVVRQNSQSDLGADGDYVPMTVDDAGGLRVSIVAGAGSGGTAAADDADFTDGTTQGTPAMGVYESTPSTVTDGDLGVVGITENRELKVSVSSGGISGKAEDAAHVSGDEGVVILAVRRDTAAVGSGTDGDYSTFNVDASGRLHVNVGNTVTVGSHAVTNAGTFAVQVDGSALTALQLIDNASIADDAAFTPATTGVTMVGFFADESATDSVDEGDGGAARMTLDRKQIVTPYAHAAAGGHTPYKNLDVDETEDEIKGSGGKLFWIHAMNLANAKRYLKIYNNTAAGVTVGTTVPDLTFPLPTMADTNGAGFCIHFGDHGIALGTGITVAATTGFADNDTGAPGANEIIFNAGYL